MKCPRGTRPALIYTQGDTSLSIWTWIWVFLNQVKNEKMKKRNKVQWIWFVFLSLNFIFLSAIAWEIQVGNRLCLMVYAILVMESKMGQFSYTVFVYHKSPADCKLSSVYMLHQEWVDKLSFMPYLSALNFSNSPVWKIKFDELDFLSFLNFIFTACAKIQFKLDQKSSSSNLIFQTKNFKFLYRWIGVITITEFKA